MPNIRSFIITAANILCVYFGVTAVFTSLHSLEASVAPFSKSYPSKTQKVKDSELPQEKVNFWNKRKSTFEVYINGVIGSPTISKIKHFPNGHTVASGHICMSSVVSARIWLLKVMNLVCNLFYLRKKFIQIFKTFRYIERYNNWMRKTYNYSIWSKCCQIILHFDLKALLLNFHPQTFFKIPICKEKCLSFCMDASNV